METKSICEKGRLFVQCQETGEIHIFWTIPSRVCESTCRRLGNKRRKEHSEVEKGSIGSKAGGRKDTYILKYSKFELHQLEFSLNIVTSMPQAISGELLSQGGEIVHIAASVPTVCENQELRPLTRTELEEILFPQSTVTIMRSLPLQKFEVHSFPESSSLSHKRRPILN